MAKQEKVQNRGPKKRSRLYDRATGAFASFFRDRGGWFGVAMSAVALLLVAATIVIAIELVCLNNRLDSARKELAVLAEDTENLKPGWVDSAFVDVQPLGLGFSLVDFKAEPVDAGVRVTGSIINGSSLDHYDAAFTIGLGKDREAKVVIPALAAGHSAPFEAVIGPAADKSIPRKVRILFSGSTVSYY